MNRMVDYENAASPGGEIGSHDRLKICCSQERAGSTPAPGTLISTYDRVTECYNSGYPLADA